VRHLAGNDPLDIGITINRKPAVYPGHIGRRKLVSFARRLTINSMPFDRAMILLGLTSAAHRH